MDSSINSVASFKDFLFSESFLNEAYHLILHDELALIHTTHHYFEENINAKKIAQLFRSHFRCDSYLHVRDFDLGASTPLQTRTHILILSCAIGFPTSHTYDDKNFTWDIKVDAADGKNFSKSSGEIPLHTDSQFKPKPENYFLLFALNVDDQSDGFSTLVKYTDLKENMLETDRGKEVYEFLKKVEFPSLTPDIFSTERKVSFGKVIEGDTIRYRKDTIINAMSQFPNMEDRYRTSLEFLDQIINNNNLIETVRLKTNDMLIINNRKCLHGRTEFKDLDRHLIRIRFE